MQPIKRIPFIHPITEKEDYLEINENLDYISFNNLDIVKNDNDIIEKLKYFLKCIDCTIIFDCGPNCILNSYAYDEYIRFYWYYLNHIKNQITYNFYWDELIKQHIKNIIFSNCENKKISTKKNIVKKSKIKNEFIRQETTDMFTNDKIYQYVNLKTGEIINSKDDNLLAELNAKKKKVKKESKVVPMFGITFNFNKK